MTATNVHAIAVEDRLAIQELTARYETEVGTGRHAGHATIRAFFLDSLHEAGL